MTRHRGCDARTTKETDVTVRARPRRAGHGDGRHGDPVLRPHAAAARQARGVRPDGHVQGRPARSTATTPWRTAGSRWARRCGGARRQGRRPAVRLDHGAARRGRGRGRAGPGGAQLRVHEVAVPAETIGTFDTGPDRGLRAGVRDRARASRSTSHLRSGRSPHHVVRGRVQGAGEGARRRVRADRPRRRALARRERSERCRRRSPSSTTASGNLHSVSRAHRARRRRRARRRPARRGRRPTRLVIPGVGHFGPCMRALRAAGFEQPIRDVARPARPVFGVCVGMQVLFECSDEDDEPGLGDPARARPRCLRTRAGAAHGMEHGRVGGRRHPFVAGHPRSTTSFYFVHSFAPDLGPDHGRRDRARPHVRRGRGARQRVRDAVPPREVRRGGVTALRTSLGRSPR